MLFLLVLISVSFAAPKELPAQRLAIDHDGELAVPEARIAIVGNTRPATAMLDKGKAIGRDAGQGVIGDMTAQNMMRPFTLVTLLGDSVPMSNAGAWQDFGHRFAGLLDGTTVPPSALRRVPTLPVVGDRDCVKNPTCEQFSKVFPGFGQEIGYGRVSTWQGFDLVVGGSDRWRVVVIDSNKKGLGSRWREQTQWLRRAVSEPGLGLIVFMHESPIARRKGEASVGATELMDLINSNAPLLSVRGVFTAGVPNNQLFLPEGSLGPIFVVAGGGGQPGVNLPRGVQGDGSEPVMDAGFDKALNKVIDGYSNSDKPPSEKSVEQALGSGSFEGFSRLVSAADFPPHGWWILEATPGKLALTWRAQQAGGSFQDQATWEWTQATGWRNQ